MITQSTITRLIKDQRGTCCNCGLDLYTTGFEIHHCCYSRDIRFAKWLDLPENLIALCPKCHRRNHGWLTNIERRKKFWKLKIEQGYDMISWERSIPFVIHDIFTEEENNATW